MIIKSPSHPKAHTQVSISGVRALYYIRIDVANYYIFIPPSTCITWPVT